MSGSRCRLDGSPFLKVGSECSKAVYEKSGTQSVSLRALHSKISAFLLITFVVHLN